MDIQTYFDDFTERDWQTTQDTDDPIRFAMIGLGWWTKEMAMPAVADSDLCTTTAVVSGSEDKAEDVAEANAAVEVGLTHDEFHDGVGAEHYDAIYIATPNATHLPYVETAAELGKQVLCEKPMEATVERAERMVEVADEAEITLMIAYRMHTEPAVRRVKDLIADGVIGEPIQIHGHMSQPLMVMIPNPDQWRLDPELAGPGATVTDIGLYPLNTARYVLDADPIGVQARMNSQGGAFDSVPDEHASFTLEFPGGVYATCTASQNAAQSSHLEIIGSEGTARIEPAFFPDQPREVSVSRGKTSIDTTFDQIDEMHEEFDYFADCLLSGRTPDGDGQHGLVDMQVIEAIYEAAERGERLEL